jgi:hypothetical protein
MARRSRLESTFKVALLRALNAPARETRVWWQFVGTVQSVDSRAWIQGAPAGAADLTGEVDGGLRLEVECKAQGGTQAPDQKKWQVRCERRGVIYVCVWDMGATVPLEVSVAAAVARVDEAIAKRRARFLSPEEARACG